MTLHEAIQKVLTESGCCMTASEIADKVNRLKLYQRGDGNPVPTSQIHARVKNYAALFTKMDGQICLRNKAFSTSKTGIGEIPSPVLAEKPSISFRQKTRTLHEAITDVLRRFDRPMTAAEIADEINKHNLYQRGDGMPVPAFQIPLRVRHYQNLFYTTNDGRIARIVVKEKDLITIATDIRDDLIHLFYQSGFSENNFQLLLPTLFLFKRMFDNPDLAEKQLNIGFADISFDGEGLVHFLIALQSSDGPFSLKVDGLIKTFTEIIEKNQSVLFSDDYLNTDLSEQKVSKKEFGAFFKELIYKMAKQQVEKAGEFYTPEIVSNLICEMIGNQINKTTRVYNPATGFATIPALLAQKTGSSFIFAGEEINKEIYLLGLMNLIVNHINTDDFVNQDSFGNETPKDKFDFAICVPPFTSKQSNTEANDHFPVKTKDFTLQFIQQCALSLQTNGRAIILVPENVLYSSKPDFIEIRKYLLDKKSIAGVISLPTNLFSPITAIKTSLLILSKNVNEQITFVELEDLDDKELFEKIQMIGMQFQEQLHEFDNQVMEPSIDYGISNYSKTGYQQIDAESYNLSAKRNMVSEPSEQENQVALERVLQPARVLSEWNRIDPPPIVTNGDLNEAFSKVYLDYKALKRNYNLANLRLVNDPVLLISGLSANPKPTFYNQENGPILIPNRIRAFVVDTAIVDIEYLVFQLSTESFKKQVEQFSTGVVLQTLTKNDFLKLTIPLPSIEKQKEIVKIQREALQALQRSEDVTSDQKAGITAKSEKELLGFIRHEIGNITGGINNDIENLKNFAERTGIDLDASITGFENGSKISEVFRRMSMNLQDIENLMLNIKGIIEVEEASFNKSEESFEKFITEEIDKISELKDHKVNVLLTVNDFEAIDNGHTIFVDKFQFGVVVRNFIFNTLKHAFEPNSSEREIVFNLRSDDDFYYFDMINNGIPFPEDFQLVDFLKFGGRIDSRKGSGIGGFLIGKVIENHSGTIELMPPGKTLYVEQKTDDQKKATKAEVHFVIKLPKE
ncbi:MAG: N-6 DNA methylase [Bacteroidales bacterium]|nr:N-6 DNA methylase [Bacteroidales bacterium]